MVGADDGSYGDTSDYGRSIVLTRANGNREKVVNFGNEADSCGNIGERPHRDTRDELTMAHGMRAPLLTIRFSLSSEDDPADRLRRSEDIHPGCGLTHM